MHSCFYIYSKILSDRKIYKILMNLPNFHRNAVNMTFSEPFTFVWSNQNCIICNTDSIRLTHLGISAEKQKGARTYCRKSEWSKSILQIWNLKRKILSGRTSWGLSGTCEETWRATTTGKQNHCHIIPSSCSFASGTYSLK